MKRAAVLFLALVGCGPLPLEVEEAEQGIVAEACSAAIDASFPWRTFAFERAMGRLPRRRGNFYILEGSGEHRCPRAVVEMWEEAFACAMGRNSLCMTGINQALAKKVGERFRGDARQRALYVTCGMPQACSGNLAITDSPADDSVSQARHMGQVLDAEGMLAKGERFQCNAALHEAIHWAGQPDENVAYGCGQLCGGECMGANDTSDCLACAGSPKEKLACGMTVELQPAVQCAGVTYGMCATSHAVSSCATCQLVTQRACDGTLVSLPSDGLCCATCTAGQHQSLPCSEWFQPNTCGQPPSMCQ